MAFKRVPQKFSASINPVTFGTGDKAVTIGGENVLPFYTFDAAIEHRPVVGIEVSDLEVYNQLPEIAEFYSGASTVAEAAKIAAALPEADFLAIKLEGADPNGEDKSVEDCVELCKAIAAEVDKPIIIEGCKNIEKDSKLFEKLADALQGKDVIFMSAKEENHKAIAVGAGLAYNAKIGAESAVDINLAKQLNVLMSQVGMKNENLVMNLGTAAAGYGFEYVVSTIDRVKGAALTQNDTMLQMPIVTPVAGDAWSVKEALVSEKDFPEWGPQEERGIEMEITTAAACLASGSNAVICRHPRSVKTIHKLINELI